MDFSYTFKTFCQIHKFIDYNVLIFKEIKTHIINK